MFVSDLQNARIDKFTVWGEFVDAWGFGVDTGAAELEVCTAASGCQEGIPGEEPGQLSTPVGIAVDSTGAIYVYDQDTTRVTKYSSDGEFLLMFGGNVNKTTGAEVCTAADVAAGDECGAGEAGSNSGFFGNATFGNFIASSPTGTVYVGDEGRIQEFNSDGTFKSEIPFTGELSALAGVSPWGVAVDPESGDIYVSTNHEGDPIYRISPTGELLDEVEETLEVKGETKTFPFAAAGLAVDSEGNLYAIDHESPFTLNGPFEVLKFSPDGDCLICGQKFAQQDTKTALGNALMGLATSNACGIPGADLYVPVFNGGAAPVRSYLLSYGPAPQDVENCPPPQVPPSITDQYASDVGVDDAEVGAKINPHFWIDTTYYVQYGPQECLDSGWTTGCSTEPLPPGDTLTDAVVSGSIATEGILLEGLEPDTVYHYRFIAQSSGGGPVIGIDGTEGTEGSSSSFHTFPSPLAKPSCSNDLFRTDLNAFLPDCRAYEMVSPVDKNGGDILTQRSILNYSVSLDLSAEDGDSVIYSSQAAFADAVSAPYASQYIARRDDTAGWQSEAISPPREEIFSPAGNAELFELDNQYKLLSPDLGSAWLMQEADPPLEPCGVESFINWYRRDNATGAYEAITTEQPPSGATSTSYLSEVQGVSADGTHAVYRANDQLPVDEGPAAANVAGYQLYEHISGPDCGTTRLVSVLPNGTANPTESSVGTGTASPSATFIESRENLIQNAVSADGSRIYWTAAGSGPGKIYVRVNGAETLPVSSGSARFWFAADDGSSAYFTEGETLRRFSFPGPGSTSIAGKVLGLVGASEDGSRAYFVSSADLDGGGGASAGEPNLYLLEGTTKTYVATLSELDISGALDYRTLSIPPAGRTASISEDGRFLAFSSDAPLSGEDNTDPASGLPDTEAFLYEAESEELRCVSCSFTGARPAGRVISGRNSTRQGYASRIPPWKNQFHAPRVISADGSTVYFESLERLVPRDENGAQDVYQWRRADSAQACEAAGADLYNPLAGGCISLISSGTGTDDSEFVDSTPNGSDVFFKTRVSLLPQDPGRVDIYDARVGGGFPPPTCETDPSLCPVPPTCPTTPELCPVPPPATDSGSGSGSPNFDPAACKPRQQKAKRLAAKARKLAKKAAKADGAKAKALGKQAKKAAKKAKRAGARAQACATGARGR